jgi:hypothetical protein
MNRNVLLYFAALSAIFASGCTKSEKTVVNQSQQSKQVSFDRTTGLALNNTGDYNNYQLINSANGQSAEIAGLSLANGGTSDLANYTGIAHQQYRITNAGNGFYTIMNLGSGKYAQSYKYNGQYILIQNSADTSDDQLWAISIVSGKGYKAISKTSGLAIAGNSPYIMQLQPYTGAANQVWAYNEVPPAGYRDDAVVGFFHRTLPIQGSIAFDQGNSIPLSNGEDLWIAEDSFDGGELLPDGNIHCGYFIEYRNSMLIQPSNHSWNPNLTSNVLTVNSTDGRPKQVFNIQPGTQWTWPGQGVQVGNKVYVAAGEGSGLGSTNQAIYELSFAGSNAVSVQRDTPAGVSNQTTIGWGGGFITGSDGYVYVYGSQGVFFNASDLYVSRFATSNPLVWYFWNGTTWASKPTTASAAVVATSQQNVAFAYWNGKYIMMQMDLGFFCDPSKHNIYLSTSNSPTGPFSAPVQVFTIEDMDQGNLIRYYTPNIHPEFNNGKNELLLTYSVNYSACTVSSECINGEMPSNGYQVKGVRVPASVIGL